MALAKIPGARHAKAPPPELLGMNSAALCTQAWLRVPQVKVPA